MQAKPHSYGYRMVRAIRRFADRQRIASLRELDNRMLADIGVHPSEFSSIEAEASGRSAVTRRRIVPEVRHA